MSYYDLSNEEKEYIDYLDDVSGKEGSGFDLYNNDPISFQSGFNKYFGEKKSKINSSKKKKNKFSM